MDGHKTGKSAMITPGESRANPAHLDELAERLGNFHESARALAACFHTGEKPCRRPGAPSTRPCSSAEKLVEKPCSRSETTSEVFGSRSERISPSRGPLELVADGHFRKQLELTVPLYRSGEWKYEFKTSSLTMTILNLFFAEAEQKGKTLKF